jgi:hypothetical protein
VEPDVLAVELRKRDLTLLAVIRDPVMWDVLVVYLHGNAGQWVDGAAVRVVSDVPGVVSVAESLQTPSILLVRVNP